MKINGSSYMKQLQMYQNHAQKSQQASKPVSKQDQVEISSTAKDMMQTNRIESERQEKVEQLRKQVADGKYDMNYNETAKKLVNYWRGAMNHDE
ncbi:flagellar biosynthesis anti-sigma factor FlgM [Tuberibacillus sp. Marseille-P3662]|uniref:flagellar biosynthesis anti-sigma factor FlgM n=1 Tax=Tuberibacillus sp. Marseille-P3662 TaxID=1965358 RepID=UPI000A1CC5D0|nr:flagellar biosynthesis anti-sigma factor FlgM [Tuberibacillus sp. Marseille-P3662]